MFVFLGERLWAHPVYFPNCTFCYSVNLSHLREIYEYDFQFGYKLCYPKINDKSIAIVDQSTHFSPPLSKRIFMYLFVLRSVLALAEFITNILSRFQPLLRN